MSVSDLKFLSPLQLALPPPPWLPGQEHAHTTRTCLVAVLPDRNNPNSNKRTLVQHATDTHNMEHEVASAKMSWSYRHSRPIVTRAGEGRRVGRYSTV